MNTAAFRIAQARYDYAEDPRFAEEYRQDAIDAEVERRLEDADYIENALAEGLTLKDGLEPLAKLIAAYAKSRTSENCYRMGAELLAVLANAVERELRDGL